MIEYKTILGKGLGTKPAFYICFFTTWISRIFPSWESQVCAVCITGSQSLPKVPRRAKAPADLYQVQIGGWHGGDGLPVLPGTHLHQHLCAILLMVQKSCQLNLGVYPTIYRVLYIPSGFLAGFLNHQRYHFKISYRLIVGIVCSLLILLDFAMIL